MREEKKNNKDPCYGAAIIKLSFANKSKTEQLKYKIIYNGVLKDLNITDKEVERYIIKNRKELVRICRERGLL